MDDHPDSWVCRLTQLPLPLQRGPIRIQEHFSIDLRKCRTSSFSQAVAETLKDHEWLIINHFITLCHNYTQLFALIHIAGLYCERAIILL